ncbi:hypothetical protein Ciccas_008373 [Cichlidogyrus casuarinus]|uniref:G-protein coupled receptors family 1 profile domain-containing protein n=1 Tax=Cichlidogyrus casuarinus TaxID=1844966 RepID=A0ABD2Q045_9PLAT
MICHPFVANKICGPAKAKISIALALLCSFVYNLPRFYEYEVELSAQQFVILDGKMVPQPMGPSLTTSAFGRMKHYRLWYHLISWVILVIGVPFTLIAVMNGFLVREVHKSAKRGRTTQQRNGRRRQDTNIMLIGVIVIFFICQVGQFEHLLFSIVLKIQT